MKIWNFNSRHIKRKKQERPLLEAEQGVVDRIAKGEEAYREYGLNMAEEAASMSISKLGLDKAKYVGEFHEISKQYTENVMQRDYEAASGMDVLTEMNNRYQTLGLSFDYKQALELLYNMTLTAQSVKANNLVSADTLI